MWLGQMEELQVVPQLLYIEISTYVNIYNYICVDVGCARDTPLVSREGTKTSRLHKLFPSWHIVLAASNWKCVQYYVLHREITGLNVSFSSTSLSRFSDRLLAGLIAGCHSVLITTTEQKQARLLLPTKRSALYWAVQQRRVAVQTERFSTVSNGRNG